jgi:hypothetical protein
MTLLPIPEHAEPVITMPGATLVGHIWTGPRSRPTHQSEPGTSWFTRSIHDRPCADARQCAARAQAEHYLRIRHTIAARAAHEAALLAHPEHRTCEPGEVLVHLEGAEDQPVPAIHTDHGPRFRAAIAEHVVAIINRFRVEDPDAPLAYFDGADIAVLDTDYLTFDPGHGPTRYSRGTDGRYPLVAYWHWHIHDDEGDSDAARRQRIHRARRFLAQRRRPR